MFISLSRSRWWSTFINGLVNYNFNMWWVPKSGQKHSSLFNFWSSFYVCTKSASSLWYIRFKIYFNVIFIIKIQYNQIFNSHISLLLVCHTQDFRKQDPWYVLVFDTHTRSNIGTLCVCLMNVLSGWNFWSVHFSCSTMEPVGVNLICWSPNFCWEWWISLSRMAMYAFTL